jgi:hypothetical protein
MSLEDALYKRLAANEGIAALEPDIYRSWRPQTQTGDCITFQRISTTPFQSNQGAIDAEQARIQVDCWASTQSGARALAEAVKDSLNGWEQDSGPAINMTTLESDRDMEEPPRLGQGKPDWRVSQDYMITFTA